MAEKNIFILHEHRDLFIKIEFPKQTSFRIVSPGEEFYAPKEKKLMPEYIFDSGQEIHLWLSKFHKGNIEIQKNSGTGWERYSMLSLADYDAEDYSPLHARPAPIVFKVGLEGSPMGGLLKPPKKQASISDEYKKLLMPSHEPTAAQIKKTELLQKWNTLKFPTMNREEGMQSCHAYPNDPNYTTVVEILPSSTLYDRLPDKETDASIATADEYTARLIADALVLTLGEALDKYKPIRDLCGQTFKIIITPLESGVIKKFIVFSGYAGVRHFINATKYGVAHTKVLTISASQLTMRELAAASASSAKSMFNVTKPSGAVLFLGLALDTIQWWSSGDKEAERLFAKFSTTILGVAFGASLAPFVAAAVGGLAVAAGVGASSVVVIAVAVGFSMFCIGVAIGYTLTAANSEGFFYNIYKQLSENWQSDLARIGYDDFESEDQSPLP